jgi:hypothetical protein
MPFTKFTNLDFDQIKTSIKDYLRANSTFTDFDFEGSNFSVLIDTLAYNTYITAFNSNMIVNESFLDSATLRENVVSLARQIGYVPRSRTAAKANVSFNIETNSSAKYLTLKAGLVCVGQNDNSAYMFSAIENITTPVNQETNIAQFTNIELYQGTLLKKQFVVNGSIDQRFILENPHIDASTIIVKVKESADPAEGIEYQKIDNILNINSTSRTYLIQEIKDEKYEIIFGDGYFGKKLENGAIITVTYLITDGEDGNGAANFTYIGSLENNLVPTSPITITTNQSAMNGGEIESIDSVKYFAPRLYSSQYRAVTTRDYEAVIQQIYPNTESVSVFGGEELSPPEYGTVLISIKPKNGTFVSEFDKQQILSKLKNYSISGINKKIVDLKILYVELDSSVYYNSSKVSNENDLKTQVINSLNLYSSSLNINKFGGRFKYSKVLQIIDNVDDGITSNITKVRMRRDLLALLNTSAQYEICFGNEFHFKAAGYNIKSTGFTIENSTELVYLTDTPDKDSSGNLLGNKMGTISIVTPVSGTSDVRVLIKSAGRVDYASGEVTLNTISITSTELPNNIIEIQAYPESNDVIGLKDLYLSFDISKSTINMVKDTISSGEQISGVGYLTTSSYSNGKLKRG